MKTEQHTNNCNKSKNDALDQKNIYPVLSLPSCKECRHEMMAKNHTENAIFWSLLACLILRSTKSEIGRQRMSFITEQLKLQFLPCTFQVAISYVIFQLRSQLVYLAWQGLVRPRPRKEISDNHSTRVETHLDIRPFIKSGNT